MTEAESRLKWTFDVSVASVGIALTFPLWLILAAAIRLTSPGPVFYASDRIGKNGCPFTMYKFRSMHMNADRSGPGITGAADPRVTSIGRALRATKLDELPQLINVVRGDMSLVGPRPEVPEYVADYNARQRQVLEVRPGMTGLTQLVYAREEQLLRAANVDREYREWLLPRKLELDLIYIANRTFLGDLRLLFATAACTVRLAGMSKAEIRRNGVQL